jgi:hypothetical protein
MRGDPRQAGSMSARQDWNVGEVVRVGFLRLRVLAKIATPGNYLPDQYALTNADGSRFYRFIPHNGLARMDSLADAMVPA